MNKEIVILETDLSRAFFSSPAKLLLWPKTAPSYLQEQYIEYCSPSHLREITIETAETILFESVHARRVGLVGSLARNEAKTFSDIDLAIFTDTDKALRLANQTPAMLDFDDIFTPPIEDVYSLIGTERKRVEGTLSLGKPVAPKGIELKNVDLHPFLMPDRHDPYFIEWHERFNPRKRDGLSFLACLGKDLLIYNPVEKNFMREENNWLVELYEEEVRNR